MSALVSARPIERPAPPESPWLRTLVKLRRNSKAWVGGGLVAIFFGFAIFAGLVAPYGPNEKPEHSETGEVGSNLPPSSAHWLGTDANEYDVFSRVIYGAKLSLFAGGLSILAAMLIGVPIGLWAGYRGGWVDALLMRSVDVFLAFPGVLIAFLVLAAFRNGWAPVIASVALINVPIFARQVRISAMTTKHLDYVEACRAIGASRFYILRKVMLPAATSPIIVLTTLGLGNAILEVAGLAFLGIGGDAGDPEWGSMLNQAKEHLSASLWPAIGPGLAITLSALGFNLLGDALRDAFDPR